MGILLNELSLHNQFQSEHDFAKSLKVIIDCRTQLRDANPLLCTSELLNRPVFDNQQLSVILQRRPNWRRTILGWLTKRGPFWDRPPHHNPDIYMYCGGVDDLVTDSSLAEAAYQIDQEENVATFSFDPSNYLKNPLQISWEGKSKPVPVPNFWEIQSLLPFIQAWEPPLTSWEDLIERAEDRFLQLSFSPTWGQPIQNFPFSSVIAKKTMRLLEILEQLKGSDRASDEGKKLYQDYFTGGEYFSDESTTNKRLFKQAMTFALESGDELFCPYHGKIESTNRLMIRLHFSWPISDDEPLHIVYLGEKITKQ